MTPTTRTPATLAVDIGGANTKAAWLQGASLRTVSRPFEIWRDREALSRVLREIAAGPVDAVAITMTAELSDAFRNKREGVTFVLDAAEDALGDRPLSVLTTAGELVSVATARSRPWDVAAANWVATALAVATADGDVFRGPHVVSGGTRSDSRGILETKREIKELRDRIAGDRESQKNLEILRAADAILQEEIRAADLYRQLWQSFCVLPVVRSVGVQGDGRTYAYPIVIRAVTSDDAMTADWARLPHELLASISSRIVNEVRGINRVVYDISSKPPSTIEWE